RGHDANDLDCAIAELELFSQGGTDGSEVSLREAVAENDYGVAAGLAFVLREESAEFRFHTQDVEEARIGDGRDQQPRLVAADAETAAAEYGHRFEDIILLAPIEVIRRRNRESFHAGKGYGRRDVKDRHDGVRIGEGKRAQENCVNNAENGRIRADSQA